MKHLRFISVGLSAGIMVCVLLAGCSSSSTHSDPDKAKFLGSLDRHKIHEATVSHQSEIQGCLNNATDAAGNDGKIALKWTVDGNGGTKDAIVTESTVGSKQAEDCAVSAANTWSFPPSPNGKSYVIGFPYQLKAKAKTESAVTEPAK